MQLAFQKIQGAGNDFVIFDNREGALKLSRSQVEHLCNRHFGIGADGVIEIRKSPRKECAAFMHYSNADGTLAEMCGNGVRCFAAYLVANELLSETEMSKRAFIADTLAGPKPITFELDPEGRLTSATVAMGIPRFAPESIPTTLSATRELVLSSGSDLSERTESAVVQSVLMHDETKYVITCVNMGNPHAVIFLRYVDEVTAQAFAVDPLSIDLVAYAGSLESNTSIFPEKTNVELATPSGANRIVMRVFERGVGETLACGTGACAVAVTAIILGEAERALPVEVEVRGGTLRVEWQPDNQVMLTGPARISYLGTIEL